MDKRLIKLNFHDLMTLENNWEDYSFSKCQPDDGSDTRKHDKFTDCCNICEGLNESYRNECKFKKEKENADDYQLTNVSHGVSTAEYEYIIKKTIEDTPATINAGIMFLFENPASVDNKRDKDLYRDCIDDKKTCNEWYWLHLLEKEIIEKGKFEPDFWGQVKKHRYDTLIASIIYKFKLKNAYITNMVKCGLVSADKFKNIGWYSKSCIDKCYDTFLRREIDIVAPQIIFAMSSNVYSKITKIMKNEIKNKKVSIVKLPHPASRYSNKDFQTKYYCTIAESLFEVGLISSDQYNEYMEEFAEFDPNIEDS